MIPIAHAGHWSLTVLEASPFFIMVIWLFVTTWRERRRQSEEQGAGEADPPEADPPEAHH